MDFLGNSRRKRICHCRTCNGIVHVIRKGDTLYKLSRYYRVNLDDIMNANGPINVYNLQIGDEICIPIRRMEPRDFERVPEEQMHMPITSNEDIMMRPDDMSGMNEIDHFENMQNMQNNMGNMHNDMGNMQSNMGDMHSDMGNMQSNMSNMHNNMGNMHNNMGNMQSNMGNMQSNMSNMQSNMGNMHGNMGHMHSNMGNKQRNMGNMKRNMGNMQSNMSNMQSNMSNMQNNMENMENVQDIPNMMNMANEMSRMNGMDGMGTMDVDEHNGLNRPMENVNEVGHSCESCAESEMPGKHTMKNQSVDFPESNVPDFKGSESLDEVLQSLNLSIDEFTSAVKKNKDLA